MTFISVARKCCMHPACGQHDLENATSFLGMIYETPSAPVRASRFIAMGEPFCTCVQSVSQSVSESIGQSINQFNCSICFDNNI